MASRSRSSGASRSCDNCARNVTPQRWRCEVETHCKLLLYPKSVEAYRVSADAPLLMKSPAPDPCRCALDGSSPTTPRRRPGSTPAGSPGGPAPRRPPPPFAGGALDPSRGTPRSVRRARRALRYRHRGHPRRRRVQHLVADRETVVAIEDRAGRSTGSSRPRRAHRCPNARRHPPD